MTITSDTMKELRALAQRVAAATRDPSLLADVRGELQRGLIGIDPESVKRDAQDYRAGRGEAILAVLTALEERSLSRESVELLLKAHRARVLAAVSQHAGLNQRELADVLDLATSNLNEYLGELGDGGFIEPAAPERGRGVAFQITPWGLQAMSYLQAHHPGSLVLKQTAKASPRRAVALGSSPEPRAGRQVITRSAEDASRETARSAGQAAPARASTARSSPASASRIRRPRTS